jgi:hypothetical protein
MSANLLEYPIFSGETAQPCPLKALFAKELKTAYRERPIGRPWDGDMA